MAIGRSVCWTDVKYEWTATFIIVTSIIQVNCNNWWYILLRGISVHGQSAITNLFKHPNSVHICPDPHPPNPATLPIRTEICKVNCIFCASAFHQAENLVLLPFEVAEAAMAAAPFLRSARNSSRALLFLEYTCCSLHSLCTHRKSFRVRAGTFCPSPLLQ